MEQVGSGFFLNFQKDEAEDEKALIEYLKENGYEQGPEGIKEFLLDKIYEERDRPKSPILNALNENPEAVQNVIEGIGKIGGKLLNAKIFKNK